MVYRWKQLIRRLLPLFVAYPGLWMLWLVLKTCRVEVEGMHHFRQAGKSQRCILCFWHHHLALIPYVLNRHFSDMIITPVASNSKDGNIIVAITKRFRFGRVFRVSHDAKPEAVLEMVKRLEAGEVLLITPDGPRGPSQIVKPGISYVTKAASATVVPFSWSADRHWKLSTWDQMWLPKPFSKIVVRFSEGIAPEHGSVEHIEERMKGKALS
jgi:lysophospholipid acyltransferase (LPLAT)-like uncharacterized protein